MGNIRRSRGYNFEHTLVRRLSSGSWAARRLGGSSTGLPDIVAVNNTNGILLTIEAKSGTSDILYVPQDQLMRCMVIRNMFGIYPERHIVLAFKFMSKKRFRRKNQTVYETRKLLEYYKVADIIEKMKNLPIIKCTYDGKTYAIYQNGKTLALGLPDYAMPFQGLAEPIATMQETTKRSINVKDQRISHQNRGRKIRLSELSTLPQEDLNK